MKLSYPAIFYPWDEGGGYTVEVPDLPGCVTEGASLAEAIRMGVEAASGWILGEIREGLPVPPPSPIEAINPEEEDDGFVNMLVLDLEEHERKFGQSRIEMNLDLEVPVP